MGGKMKTDMEEFFRNYHLSPQPSDGTTGVFLASLGDGSSYGSVRDIDYNEGRLIIISKPPVPTFLPLADDGGTRLAWEKMREGGMGTA
jgi:hypothetical protein